MCNSESLEHQKYVYRVSIDIFDISYTNMEYPLPARPAE